MWKERMFKEVRNIATKCNERNSAAKEETKKDETSVCGRQKKVKGNRGMEFFGLRAKFGLSDSQLKIIAASPVLDFFDIRAKIQLKLHQLAAPENLHPQRKLMMNKIKKKRRRSSNKNERQEKIIQIYFILALEMCSLRYMQDAVR